jgi:hypothetical protein
MSLLSPDRELLSKSKQESFRPIPKNKTENKVTTTTTKNKKENNEISTQKIKAFSTFKKKST